MLKDETFTLRILKEPLENGYARKKINIILYVDFRYK